MMLNNHRWIVKVLALLLVSFVTWWATQVWGTQEEQETSITTLQTNIIAVEDAVIRIEDSLAKDRIYRRQQDSILMDVAIKVNIMFEGR